MTHDDSTEGRPDSRPETRPAPREPEPRSLAGRAAGLFVLVGIVFLTLGAFLQVTELASGLWITQLFIFLLPALLFARASNATARSFLRLDHSLGARLIGLVLLASVANYFVAAAMMGLCRKLLPESWQVADAAKVLSAVDGPRLGLIIFAVVVLAPLCEEALFRGALQRSLSGRLGPGRALLLTALAFSALHIDPIGFLPRFELGLLFGWLVIRTGALAAPILAHAVNNGAATFLFFLAGAGSEPETEAPSWVLLAFLGAGALVLLPTLQAIARLTPQKDTDPRRPLRRLDPARPIAWRPNSREATALAALLFLALGAFAAFIALARPG